MNESMNDELWEWEDNYHILRTVFMNKKWDAWTPTTMFLLFADACILKGLHFLDICTTVFAIIFGGKQWKSAKASTVYTFLG